MNRLVTICCLVMFASLPAQAQRPVQDRVQREAQAFRLEDVRLLDGPFKQAMMRDAEYLLRLEPDRLLSGFRKEAGLAPKAQVYGGWESMTIAGHSLGHYLSACALMFASTGDVRFRERVNYIVAELETCRANGNGYVAAIPNGKKIFQEVSAGDIRVKPFDLNGGWVPWYTLHKLFAGLLDVHRHFQNARALTIAIRLADWADSTLHSITTYSHRRILTTVWSVITFPLRPARERCIQNHSMISGVVVRSQAGRSGTWLGRESRHEHHARHRASL